MGLWGAFMPAGIGLSMIITPWLVEWHGWRGLWNDVGILLLIWCVVLYLGFRRSPLQPGIKLNTTEFIASILRLGPLLVVAGFMLFLRTKKSNFALCNGRDNTVHGLGLSFLVNTGFTCRDENIV